MKEQLISINTNIPNLGKVEGLHYKNLFEYQYLINGKTYNIETLKEFVFKNKSVITDRVLDLLVNKNNIALKFLTNIVLKTQNLYLINKLSPIIDVIHNLISTEDFDFDNYTDYQELKNNLTIFWFNYYTFKNNQN